MIGQRLGNGAGTRIHTELRQNVVDMNFYGAFRNRQSRANFPILHSRRHKTKNFEFSSGQPNRAPMSSGAGASLMSSLGRHIQMATSVRLVSASVGRVQRCGCEKHVGEEAHALGFKPCDDESLQPATTRRCAIEAAREVEDKQSRLCDGLPAND
jgi:hypothetical protein